MRLQYAELTYALDTLRRDRERRDREMAALAEGLQKLEKEKAEREEALARARETLQAQEEAFRAQEKTVALCQAKAQELEVKRQEKAAAQRECVRVSEEIHQAYDEDSMKLHRTELSRDRAENELKVMTDHIFNTYDLTYAGAEEFRVEGVFELGNSEKEAASLRSRIREMGPVNVGAIEEYAATKERFDSLTAQEQDLTRAESDLQDLIERLLRQMEKQFVKEFAKLGEFFKETFTRLFGGGQAELRLTDPDDALNCGIEIIAQPPGKKLQLLSLLSGGERALTAIAILFAMLKLKPTPFCILDEIEAALDEANIGYFADYLAEYAKTTQFVVITHRKGTMERCDALYGVAMQERGVSSMVSVNLQDYE